MKECIKLKSQGIFYNVYDKDAYVLYSITDYKITNGRLGFPINSLEKIKKILDDKNINYKIIDNKPEEKTFNKNNYNKYYKLGKRLYDENITKNNLVKNIKKLPHDKILEISKYVNYIIYK